MRIALLQYFCQLAPGVLASSRAAAPTQDQLGLHSSVGRVRGVRLSGLILP